MELKAIYEICIIILLLRLSRTEDLLYTLCHSDIQKNITVCSCMQTDERLSNVVRRRCVDEIRNALNRKPFDRDSNVLSWASAYKSKKKHIAWKIYCPEESSTADFADSRSSNQRRLMISRGNRTATPWNYRTQHVKPKNFEKPAETLTKSLHTDYVMFITFGSVV